MARNPDWEPMYQAYQDFARACLVEDRSLIWPDRALWTPSNVSGLKRCLIDTPALGKESFEDKLVIQLANQPPELWGVLADAYYLFCLAPDNIKASTKHAGVARLAQKGLLPVPDADQPIWKAMDLGFCNSGQRYWQKYREIWLIFLFAEQVKQAKDRSALIGDRQTLQDVLDGCLQRVQPPADRAADMRNALLYLAYPDYYEPIISTSHKKSIVDGLRGRLSGEVPVDVDATIYEIRKELEKDTGFPKKPHFFYQPEIKPLWLHRAEAPAPRPPEPPRPLPPETAGTLYDLLRLFAFTKNVIIYGPPGTGKTYIANQAAHQLVKKQLAMPVPESVVLQGIAEVSTFYDLLALGMYVRGKDKHLTVDEILGFPVVQARYQSRPIKSEKQNIWSNLQTHTSPDSKTVHTVFRAEPYLFDKDSASHWFLTEPGREYLEESLSDTLHTLQSPRADVAKAEDFITSVAFHQSYAYEDFVEGFRPVRANEIDIVPGKFREVCAQAAANPDGDYVLVIDEINRGNISKIFGELITLLEDDKRDGQPGCFPVELAYSHLKFKVPPNLYIIGTMNTADRSIALLDVALRRRFAFYELLPEPELLQGMVVRTDDGDEVDLEKLLRALNLRISKELGSDYQIGHSYLMKVTSTDGLEFAWNNQILPLLREYFYSQPEQLMEVLEPYLRGREEGDLRLPSDDLVVALGELAK